MCKEFFRGIAEWITKDITERIPEEFQELLRKLNKISKELLIELEEQRLRNYLRIWRKNSKKNPNRRICQLSLTLYTLYIIQANLNDGPFRIPEVHLESKFWAANLIFSISWSWLVRKSVSSAKLLDSWRTYIWWTIKYKTSHIGDPNHIEIWCLRLNCSLN